MKRILLCACVSMLALMLALSMSACTIPSILPGSNDNDDSSNRDDNDDTDNDRGNDNNDDPDRTPGTEGDDLATDGDTAYPDFIRAMDELCASGDTLREQGLTLQADSYYAFAGCSISSLRFAVECILWLKGEGDDIASFTADSRYAGWEQIATISYASPYPYYFEGLVYHVQAKNEDATAYYQNALLNPAYPDDGVNFYYLKDTSVQELYAMRDALRAKEDEIYAKFAPTLIAVERDPYLFETGYLRAKSAEAMASGDYTAAATYAKIAVANDPLDAENFKNAVLCCIASDELSEAGSYLDWGLLIAPDDEGLGSIYQVFLQMGGNAE